MLHRPIYLTPQEGAEPVVVNSIMCFVFLSSPLYFFFWRTLSFCACSGQESSAVLRGFVLKFNRYMPLWNSALCRCIIIFTNHLLTLGTTRWMFILVNLSPIKDMSVLPLSFTHTLPCLLSMTSIGHIADLLPFLGKLILLNSMFMNLLIVFILWVLF